MKNCIVCGKIIYNWEKYICTKCRADFPFTYFWNTLNNSIETNFREHSNLHRAFSLFYYSNNYKQIIHSLKYNDHPELGIYFGEILGKYIAQSFSNNKNMLPEYIVPVPLHWLKRIKRSYNQAEMIAIGISNGIYKTLKIRIPIKKNIIRRVHITNTQTKKNKEDRKLNMQMAFVPIIMLNKFPILKNFLPNHNAHFLVVDDVFTTGATLNAAVTAIRSNPRFVESRISIATLAYVE